jgi:hypothetical protein
MLNLILALRRWWPFRARLSGFVLIHISVIVILLGASLTRFLGYEGTMFIREGEVSDHIFSREDHIQLTIRGETGSFPVRLFRPGPSEVGADLVLGDTSYRIAVTRFWPRYGEVYAEGEGGTPALEITTTMSEETRQEVVLPGSSLDLANAIITYSPGDLPDPAESVYGTLKIGSESQQARLDVGFSPDLQIDIDGHMVIIQEFNPDFRVGGEPPGVPTMSNPMVRVDMLVIDGSWMEWTLFAHHPESSREREIVPGSASQVTVSYEVDDFVVFGGKGQELRGISSVGLVVSDGGGAGQQVLAAGQLFSARAGMTYRAVTGGFSARLDRVLASAVPQPVQSTDPEAPSVVEIEVTDGSGAVASARVPHGIREPARVLLGQQVVGLGYGPVKVDLPYRIMLDDFVVRTYPGSTNPVDFESRVRLFDDEKGIEGTASRIYMNHPLTHRGFKHFQSSFDEDHLGTVLTVNFDPGKIPTYIGYVLITLGFVLVFLKDLIWKTRAKRPNSEGGVA